MKVYVDELPESCYECFANYDIIECTLIDEERTAELARCLDRRETKRYSKCPLQLLSAHDEAVRDEERKRVCERVRKVLFDYLKVSSMKELEKLSLIDSTLTYDVITDELDQIEGENK